MKETDLGEELLCNIHKRLPVLEELLSEVTSHWAEEDAFYRYYHGSSKVYRLQYHTTKIVEALKLLAPENRPLNGQFLKIISEGTGREFEISDNEEWDAHTLPILQGFYHARFMLKYVCKYGRELTQAPQMLPSGWAAVLYLYHLR